MHVAVGVWLNTLLRRDVTLSEIVTSRHGDHSWRSLSRLPERAITTVQAPGDRKNPSVLWLKYDFSINKTGIFAIHFYFLYFFNANDDHDIFFNSRIRFLVRSRLVPGIDWRYRKYFLFIFEDE